MNAIVSQLSVFGFLLLPTLVSAQSFATFDQVDYVTVQDFSVFEAVWEKAETQNTRIALFGDSQETSPGGAGAVYVPALNYEFYQHFGKVGESFVAPSFGSYGGGRPAAEWLLKGSHGSSTGNSAGTLTSSQILPGHNTRTYTSAALGQNTLLTTSNLSVQAGGVAGQGGPLWGADDLVSATIYGVSRPGSDELSWRTSPTNSNSLNFFRANSGSGTTSIGLDSSEGQVLSQDIGNLNFAGFQNQQLIVKGAGDSGAELAGVRFTNHSTPGGVSIQDFSAGGYRTRDFLENHGEAGQMLAAFGAWDAILVHTGANDAYSGGGRSALEFQGDILEFIQAIRSEDWLDNPNQKFILVTDPYRDAGPENQNAQFDQYAGALADLALQDPNILAINSRRATEELGWNAENSDQFLSDVVHYTPEGARLLASVESQLILTGSFNSVPEPSSFYATIFALGLLGVRRRR